MISHLYIYFFKCYLFNVSKSFVYTFNSFFLFIKLVKKYNINFIYNIIKQMVYYDINNKNLKSISLKIQIEIPCENSNYIDPILNPSTLNIYMNCLNKQNKKSEVK